MRDPDQLTKHRSPANNAGGPATNMMQNFADARQRQTAERDCRDGQFPPGDLYDSPPNEDWAQRSRDYAATAAHDRHFGQPGGGTYNSGEIVPIHKGK